MHGGDVLLLTGVMTRGSEGAGESFMITLPLQRVVLNSSPWRREKCLNPWMMPKFRFRYEFTNENKKWLNSGTVCFVSTSSRMGLVIVAVIQKWKLDFCKSEFVFVKGVFPATLCVPDSEFQGLLWTVQGSLPPDFLSWLSHHTLLKKSDVAIRYLWPAKNQGWGEWYDHLQAEACNYQTKIFLYGNMVRLKDHCEIFIHVTAPPSIIWNHMT